MGHSLSATIRPPFIGSLCRSAPNDEPQHSSRPHSPSIHILDDDSLLNIFDLYRPLLLDEGEDEDIHILQGGEWARERWWYKLTHVCRRWRYLVLGSASSLGLGLICTYGTPVADMLAHSPPFPLIIDYVDEDRDITLEDEEGIMVALQHHDRVRRIRLWMPVPDLQKLIMAIDDEFPVLEYLYILPTSDDTDLILPQTFQAPHLRHLVLHNFAFPTGSPLLTTALGLVTLSLQRIPRSAYLHPNGLLQQLSQMPQLEVFGIDFRSPFPNRDVKIQLLDTRIVTHVTLPNLRLFGFRGNSAYLEALLARMSIPFLKKFQVRFADLPTVFHIPEFLLTAKKLKFSGAASARMGFSAWDVWVRIYPRAGEKTCSLEIAVECGHLHGQVVYTAQIFNSLGAVFSAVEHLTLERRRYSFVPEWDDQPQWRILFRSFSNVKTLRVDDGLVMQLSYFLGLEDRESPMDLLPELKELSYPSNGSDAFMAFIDARQKAGHPVTLHRL